MNKNILFTYKTGLLAGSIIGVGIGSLFTNAYMCKKYFVLSRENYEILFDNEKKTK